MSTPNHEFPSGTQPQGSGQSPQTPAGYSYPQAQMPWQGQNPQTTWYSDPSQATMQAPQQTLHLALEFVSHEMRSSTA